MYKVLVTTVTDAYPQRLSTILIEFETRVEAEVAASRINTSSELRGRDYTQTALVLNTPVS